MKRILKLSLLLFAAWIVSSCSIKDARYSYLHKVKPDHSPGKPLSKAESVPENQAAFLTASSDEGGFNILNNKEELFSINKPLNPGSVETISELSTSPSSSVNQNVATTTVASSPAGKPHVDGWPGLYATLSLFLGLAGAALLYYSLTLAGTLVFTYAGIAIACGIAALTLGKSALGKTGVDSQKGRGFALIGVVLGYIGILGGVGACVLQLLFDLDVVQEAILPVIGS